MSSVVPCARSYQLFPMYFPSPWSLADSVTYTRYDSSSWSRLNRAVQ